MVSFVVHVRRTRQKPKNDVKQTYAQVYFVPRTDKKKTVRVKVLSNRKQRRRRRTSDKTQLGQK